VPPEQALHLDQQEALVDLHPGPAVALAVDLAALAVGLALAAVDDASIRRGGACAPSA
tara:strand:+ start:743 stop:916 length:174 start_codon:yes stop_codon:yes gene_type:complete